MIMTAKSPPARPHIAINPSSHFGAAQDWGEDDAWDSASDSESPKQSTISIPWNKLSTASAPKPVPRPTKNNSSSTLAFSYTHLNAPNPGSYPPKTTDPSAQNGWTIVTKSSVQEQDETEGAVSESVEVVQITSLGHEQDDLEVDGDMVIGDFDTDPLPGPPRHRGMPPTWSIREDADKIVDDPLHDIQRRVKRSDRSSSPIAPQRSSSPRSREKSEKLIREKSIRSNRKQKFVDCLSSGDINIAELRKLAWAGIPEELRPIAWPLLLGYLPLHTQSRSPTLTRKREEYQSLVEVTFARGKEGLDQQIWHQIEIDVPRTRPGVSLWMYGATQRSLERILYVWAIRHPASGYVQGINDLVTPFFQVFLSAYIDSDPELFDPSNLPPQVLHAIEADSFWCLSRLLDGIQDNYIFAQPGIQRSVRRMAELVARIDAPLSAHLQAQNVEFMQFAFRWMNCLLMREISVRNTIRMWDTYLAEGTDAFSQFHLYVCSAFLVRWSEKLRQMDFQGIIMFLQSLPTQNWGDHEIEMLLSEAFVLNSIWHNAQSHFNAK